MAPKTSSATLRLKQDYVRLKNDPVPYIVAEPNPSNILEWYAVQVGKMLLTIHSLKLFGVIQVLRGERTR